MGENTPGDPVPETEDMNFDIRSMLTQEQNEILKLNHRLSPIHSKILEELQSRINELAKKFEKDNEVMEQLTNIYHKVKNLQAKKVSYNAKDKAPYVVIVENIDNSSKGLHPMDLGKQLHQWGISIQKISKKGLNKVGITCFSVSDANKLLCNPQLNKNGRVSYVPQSFITSKGIIKDVGLSVNESDILKYGISSARILDAQRLNRRIKEGDKVKYVPSMTMLLTFDSKLKPEEISIFACPIKVHNYIPPLNQCHNCQRFGHKTKICKSKARCSNCGELHKFEECENSTKCIFCHENHKAFDKSCKEYDRQYKLRELMTFHELSYYEAAKICPPLFKSKLQENFLRSPQSFPSTLYNTRRPLPPQYSHQTHASVQDMENEATELYFHPTNPNIPNKRKKRILVEKPLIHTSEIKEATFAQPTRTSSPNGLALSSTPGISYASMASSPSPAFSPITPGGPIGSEKLNSSMINLNSIIKDKIHNTKLNISSPLGQPNKLTQGGK